MGTTSTRTERKAQTRRSILEAARHLLRRDGAEALTSRAVAEASGVASGTVFLHFPTTSHLFEALLDEQLARALSEGFRTAPDGPLVARLCHVARCLFESYDVEPALARIILSRALFTDDGPRGDARLDELLAWVTEQVREANTRGLIEPIEPALGASLFFSQYFTLLVGGLRGALARPHQLALLEAGLDRVFFRRRPT